MKKNFFAIDPSNYYRRKHSSEAVTAALKELARELQPYPLMTHSGQSVTLEVDKYGRLIFSIDCNPEEFDLLMAEREARKKADEARADAVKVARAALSEAKSRDYSDEGMKRSFGVE